MKKKSVTKNLQTAIEPLQTYVRENLPIMCRFEGRPEVYDAQIAEFYSVHSDNIEQFVTNMQEDMNIDEEIKIRELIKISLDYTYDIEKKLINLHFMNENDKNEEIKKSHNICLQYGVKKFLEEMQNEECPPLRCSKN